MSDAPHCKIIHTYALAKKKGCLHCAQNNVSSPLNCILTDIKLHNLLYAQVHKNAHMSRSLGLF